MADVPLIPSDVPSDLPKLGPGVIVVTHPEGTTFYRVFPSAEMALISWETDEFKLRAGDRAFLFQEGALIALRAEL